MIRASLITLVLLFTHATLQAAPAQILIIRHGEKKDDYDPYLSAKGRRRADALVKVFLNDPRFNLYGPPVAIYAALPHHVDSSHRPELTMKPLADKLHIKINLDYRKKKNNEIADDIVFNHPEYNNKTVIICWIHPQIPQLALELGSQQVPAKWTKHAYDRVWRIKFDGQKAGPVEDLPERALPGDSKE